MRRRSLTSCCPCWHTTRPRGPRPPTACGTPGSPRRRRPVVVPGTTAPPPAPETRPSSLRVPIPRRQTSVGPRRHHRRPRRRPEKAAPARCLCVVVCSNRGGLAALWGRSAVDGGGGGRGVISTPRVACVLQGFLGGGSEWRGKEQVTLDCAFLSVKLRVLLHIWNLSFRKDLGCFLFARSFCLTPPARQLACT